MFVGIVCRRRKGKEKEKGKDEVERRGVEWRGWERSEGVGRGGQVRARCIFVGEKEGERRRKRDGDDLSASRHWD